MPLLPIRSHTKTVALSYPVREHVRLTSSKDVENLLRAAKLRREVVSEIQVLEVLINDTAGIKPIRAVLPLTRNIEALVLKFPFKPIQPFPTSLNFDHLVSLSCNIPHATIALFLQSHPRLETLQLGACSNTNTQICPLTHYALKFPHLVELICPPSCVRALIAGSIVNKLLTTYDGVKRLYFPIYKLLDFRQIETSASLTTLHIDFDHRTPQLLHRISVAAPALRVLRLTESRFSHKDLEMPWHEPDWVDGFRSLRFLVDFELQTWYHLEETNCAEIQTIMQWVNAASRLRYAIVLSGVRQNERRQVVWNKGELSIRELIEDHDIAFI